MLLNLKNRIIAAVTNQQSIITFWVEASVFVFVAAHVGGGCLTARLVVRLSTFVGKFRSCNLKKKGPREDFLFPKLGLFGIV